MPTAKQEIVEVLRQLPYLTRYEIADLVDRPKTTILKAVQLLEKQGRIVAPKDQMKMNGYRKLKAYCLNDNRKAKVYPVVNPAPAPVSPELEELRQFKAMVLELHPELAIPPVTRRARDIVMQYVDEKLAAEVKAGRKDSCPIMLAVIHALEEK